MSKKIKTRVVRGVLESVLADAYQIVEDLSGEVADAVANARTQTPRIVTLSETSEVLTGIRPVVFEDSADLDELTVEYIERYRTDRHGLSRQDQCENAVAMMRACCDAAEAWLDAEDDKLRETIERNNRNEEDASEEAVRLANDLCEKHSEQLSSWRDQVSEIRDQALELEDAEFPGWVG